MSSKTLLLIPMLGLVSLLSACAAIPKADPSEAWIGLQEDPLSDLMAERVDGKRLNDGRYFEVTPGSHRLDMTLYVDGMGDDNQEECQAHIDFSQFKAGEHYKLVETSLGEEYRVNLEDSHGKQIGHSKDFTCLAG